MRAIRPCQKLKLSIVNFKCHQVYRLHIVAYREWPAINPLKLEQIFSFLRICIKKKFCVLCSFSKLDIHQFLIDSKSFYTKDISLTLEIHFPSL